MSRRALLLLPALLALLAGGCATSTSISAQAPSLGWPKYRLLADQITVLTPPNHDRFDASGLLLTPAGDLLTLRNNADSILYRIEFQPGGKEALLRPMESCFTSNQLTRLEPGRRAFDTEGIAQDPQGRYYICEERHRLIYRCDPRVGRTEILPIDWTPVKEYFTPLDSNASFEGIAIGRGNLYVANERNSPLIIVVDLASLRIKDHFMVDPSKASFLGTHYSDLCWFEDRLWVLCRQHRVILQVDPARHRVLAEYDFGNLEESLGYRTGLPVGIMEGLAVDRESFWLVTDNNGDPRGRTGHDIRPTLVRCARPDRR